MLFGDWIVDFLAPVVGAGRAPRAADARRCVITLLVVAVVAIGVALAWFLVGKREVPREAPQDVSFVTRAARADLYGDAINDTLVVEPGRHVVSRPHRHRPGRRRRRRRGRRAAPSAGWRPAPPVQNGFVRSYALSLLGGVLLVALALLAVNLA